MRAAAIPAQTERDRRTGDVIDSKPDPYAPDYAAREHSGEFRQRKRIYDRQLLDLTTSPLPEPWMTGENLAPYLMRRLDRSSARLSPIPGGHHHDSPAWVLHLQLADMAPDLSLDWGQELGEAFANAKLAFSVSALALMQPEERSAVVEGLLMLGRGYERDGRPRWGQRLLRTPRERELFAVMADQLGKRTYGVDEIRLDPGIAFPTRQCLGEDLNEAVNGSSPEQEIDAALQENRSVLAARDREIMTRWRTWLLTAG